MRNQQDKVILISLLDWKNFVVFYLLPTNTSDQKIQKWKKILFDQIIYKYFFYYPDFINYIIEILKDNNSILLTKDISKTILQELQHLIEHKKITNENRSQIIILLKFFDETIENIFKHNFKNGIIILNFTSSICCADCVLETLCAAPKSFYLSLKLFNIMENKYKYDSLEPILKSQFDIIYNNPNEIKAIISYMATYVFIATNKQKSIDLFCENMNLDAIQIFLNHETLEVRRKMIWLLNNLYCDFPVIHSHQ